MGSTIGLPRKDPISSRSVSVHLYLSYDALCAYRRGCGDK